MNFLDFLKIRDLSEIEYISEKCESDVIPDELIECKCCDKHKNNFPKITNNGNVKWNGMLDWDKETDYYKESECRCPCRHIARHICIVIENRHIYDNLTDSDSDSDSDSESQSLGEDSERSEDSDSAGSLKDFIVEDSGMSSRERRKLEKAVRRNKRW